MTSALRFMGANMAAMSAIVALCAAAWLAAAPLAIPASNLEGFPLSPVPAIADTADTSPENLAAAILARPLFVQGRRPQAADAGGALSDFRLSGTIATSRVRKALFSALSDAATAASGRWLGEGEEISGWRIAAIEPGQVTLRRGSEQVLLSITRRRALTPKQMSQAKAATPIRAGDLSPPSSAEGDTRGEQLRNALANVSKSDFYGTPD